MKNLILPLLLAMLLPSCRKVAFTEMKYVCTCEQSGEVAAFVSDLVSDTNMDADAVAEVRKTGVMLLCGQRAMLCDEDGEPYWWRPENQLDSCEIYQF